MKGRLGFIGGLGSALLVCLAASAAEPTARLATYEKASGEKFFALSLAPVTAPAVADKTELVLLVDTSASQAGRFRDDSLTAVRELLSTLPANTTVKLMAIDVKPIALSTGFVAPNGQEMEAALAKLNNRVPLGATDLPAGVSSAMNSFEAGSAAAKHVIYFGDGMSKANLLTRQNFEPLVRQLSGRQVSVSSYAIGGDRNAAMLAALANQTGGNIVIDNDDPQAPQQAAAELTKTLSGTVVWPTAVTLPKAFAQSFPATLPPLRTDRDTILIGLLQGEDAMDIRVTGDNHGQAVSLAWTVTPEASNEDFSFLPQLVEVARKDDGMSLPTIGSQGLVEAARVTQESADNLAKLGEKAMQSGNVEGARQVAQAILARDPQHPAGLALQSAANNPKAKTIAISTEAELRLVAKNQSQPSLLDDFEPPMGLADSVAQEQQVLVGKIKAEVELAVKEARERLGSNAEASINSLKVQLEAVQLTPELTANDRLTLMRMIESVIREAERQKEIQDREKAFYDEQRATANELSRVNDALDRRNIKLKQVMDRFSALMDERKYSIAVNEVLPEVVELARDEPIAAVAVYGGRAQRAYREINQIWDERERGFHEVMMLIEKAQIPFPDEPPVVYTDPEKWLDLTLRRQKYKSVDLAKTGSSEAKILDALKETTQCEFFASPLKDVVAYFAEIHQIPIVLNTRDLDEVGITSDTPIDKTLKGISLRSALRLILNDHGLTYMIRDEVLQITNPDVAQKPENLIRKVYPVGDLVVPITLNTNLFGIGGGGLGGGGLGGLGQGNQQGFGGGGGGQQFGGGGGGGIFQDVPDSLSLGSKKPVAEAPAAAPAPAATTPAKPAPKVASIKLEPKAGESRADAWNRYFASQKEQFASVPDETALAAAQAAVRQTVRELVDAKNFEEVALVLKAAIRNGLIEAWMYEALTLALDASNAPAEEIERTLMSAVDYASAEEQIMLTAAYMIRLGHEQRGLDLYRQAAVANPLRPEAFLRALDIAQNSNNLEAIQWSSLGLLRQAWTKEQQEVGVRALRAAKFAYLELLKQGKKDAADHFERQAAHAAGRDVVIEVTWTGDADIDMQVTEPAGTVCSATSPRTTSGGVFVGDAYAVPEQPMGGKYTETYICPEGFAGDYQVLLRNIWGKAAGGKVTVDIYTNYLSDKGQRIHHQIPLGEKMAKIEFNLKEGRRAEALPEAQVANVAKVQNAVDRAVLAQQLAAMDDSAAARAFQQQMTQLGRLAPNLFSRRGAVGYRPIITTLPEGANFSSNAVISADRRYVRVSPTPTFSQVTDVVTYNTSSGATNNTSNQFMNGGNGFFGGGGGGGNQGVGGGMGGMGVR